MVAKGDVPVNITWLLDGKPVDQVRGITITNIGHKTSSLSIEYVTSVHKGTYTCSVANLAGHTDYSSELSVNGIHTLDYITT